MVNPAVTYAILGSNPTQGDRKEFGSVGDGRVVGRLTDCDQTCKLRHVEEHICVPGVTMSGVSAWTAMRPDEKPKGAVGGLKVEWNELCDFCAEERMTTLTCRTSYGTRSSRRSEDRGRYYLSRSCCPA